MKNKWLFIAALSGFFCVAFGAFAAHTLEKTATEQSLIWIEKGLKYQMFHTIALLALGLFQIAISHTKTTACKAKYFNLAGLAWTMGIVLFSGSLYILALGGNALFVWTTPVGGMAFLAGWVALIYASLGEKK